MNLRPPKIQHSFLFASEDIEEPMNRFQEFIALVVSVFGISTSQSTLLIFSNITVGMVGTILFFAGVIGMIFDDIKEFFDFTAY